MKSFGESAARSLLVLLVTLGASSCGGGEEMATGEPAAPMESAVAMVSTGLDRVAAGEVRSLAGPRLGLVVHGPSQTRDGRHAIDVFSEGDFDVVRLFTPEHGLRGAAAAGEEVDDGVDPASGLPIVSLYGSRSAPEPGHLEDLDVLVVDLQDAGVRFYTYVSTMLLSATAALEAGVDVVVLDRPNPLGGEVVSGPFREPDVPLTMVSRAPGPLVHGLTMGEIARLSFPEAAEEGRVRVVEMEGWRRDQRWRATALPWRNPSPNLRSPEAALLYPATAFFEATNVSEGRGTDAPFRLFGAPWFDDRLLEDLSAILSEHGVGSAVEEFVPAGSPAAPSPRYVGEVCRGLRLQPTDGPGDGGQSDPYRLGLDLLRRLEVEPPFELRRDGAALTWLLGSTAATRVLQGELSIEEHFEELDAEHRRWRQERAPFLLYR